MFRSLSKYNILKSKKIQNTIIILLILLMLFIIFWMFFVTLWRTIRSILSKEGFDPEAPLPNTEIVSVSINEDKPVSFSDNEKKPEITPFGKYYLINEKKSNNLNIITLGADPSGVNIDFDGSLITKLLIYPANISENDSKKANIFPNAFTVNISMSNLSKNYTTKYIDVSGDEYKNYIINYISPNKDISGSFINMVLAIPNIQSPIYENKKSLNDIGTIQSPSTNNFSINVTDKGSKLNGIIINMKPPTNSKKSK
jgi:hypothetical protein